MARFIRASACFSETEGADGLIINVDTVHVIDDVGPYRKITYLNSNKKDYVYDTIEELLCMLNKN